MRAWRPRTASAFESQRELGANERLYKIAQQFRAQITRNREAIFVCYSSVNVAVRTSPTRFISLDKKIR